MALREALRQDVEQAIEPPGPLVKLAIAQPSVWRRVRWPLAVVFVLVVALGWSLAHARYEHAPRAVAAPAPFSIAPPSAAASANARTNAAAARRAVPHPQPNHLYIPSL